MYVTMLYTLRNRGVFSTTSVAADSWGTLHNPARTARPSPAAAVTLWLSLMLLYDACKQIKGSMSIAAGTFGKDQVEMKTTLGDLRGSNNLVMKLDPTAS